MDEWGVNDRKFFIRDAAHEADYRGVEEAQREVWQCSDLDVVGSLTLIATQHAGGILLCAFENEEMIGFTYGFPAFEGGRVSIHSHMAAVRDAWRGRALQVGFYLKLAQREATLARGLREITWTFDPLQSLNAHFNFAKLGVTSNRYFVNFYGDASTRFERDPAVLCELEQAGLLCAPAPVAGRFEELKRLAQMFGYPI